MANLLSKQQPCNEYAMALCDVPDVEPDYTRWIILWIALFGSALVLYGLGDIPSKIAGALYGAGLGGFIFWKLRWFTKRGS